MRTEVVLWGCVALGLIVLEVMLPGAFMLWLGVAAGVVLALVLVFPGLGAVWQAVVFVLASLALIPVYRHFLRPLETPSKHPLLNRRAAQFVGQSFVLHSAIVSGKGRIKMGDALWTVSGPDLPAGERVRVVDADAMMLTVVPESAPV
ncbi:MAG: NfeD family protein [Arenimonas sp.]